MEIQTNKIDDHRKLTLFVDTNKAEYYTHRLSEDRTLRVVVRGIHLSVDVADFDSEFEKCFKIGKFCLFNRKNCEKA